MAPPEIPKWVFEMFPPGFNRYRVKTGPYAMHVMEWGRGFPVLMLHGNPTWAFLYRKVVRELYGLDLHIIVPDLIGFGFSDRPEDLKEHSVENHAKWLGALIDQLKLPKLILVGQDWGGPIGLRALANRPQLLKGLVLMNTSVTPPRQGFKPTRFHQLSQIPLLSDVAFRLFNFPQKFIGKVQGSPESIQGPIQKAYELPLKKFADNGAPLALARMVPNSQHHPSIQSLEITKKMTEEFMGPAAIVWGKKDPILGKSLKKLRTLLPQATVLETSAGHFVQEESAPEIARAIYSVYQKILLENNPALNV